MNDDVLEIGPRAQTTWVLPNTTSSSDMKPLVDEAAVSQCLQVLQAVDQANPSRPVNWLGVCKFVQIRVAPHARSETLSYIGIGEGQDTRTARLLACDGGDVDTNPSDGIRLPLDECWRVTCTIRQPLDYTLANGSSALVPTREESDTVPLNNIIPVTLAKAGIHGQFTVVNIVSTKWPPLAMERIAFRCLDNTAASLYMYPNDSECKKRWGLCRSMSGALYRSLVCLLLLTFFDECSMS